MTSLSSRSIRQSSRFALISAHIARELSTKVTWAAPREMASIPTAPEPAQRSRNRTPAIRGAITLKRVSRRRSEVGRTSSEGGLLRFRPRNFPAMIRNTDSRFEQNHQSTDYADYTEENTRNGVS